MLTCDPKIGTLDCLKIMISLLIFSLYMYSSFLICPSSFHCFENSCFPEPLVGVSLAFTSHIPLFERLHSTLWKCFQVFCVGLLILPARFQPLNRLCVALWKCCFTTLLQGCEFITVLNMEINPDLSQYWLIPGLLKTASVIKLHPSFPRSSVYL